MRRSNDQKLGEVIQELLKLYRLEDKLDEVVAQLDGPLAADLFCGAGGLSLGLAEAGYQVVVAFRQGASARCEAHEQGGDNEQLSHFCEAITP